MLLTLLWRRLLVGGVRVEYPVVLGSLALPSWTDSPFFRLLLMLPMDEDVRDPKRPPMVELLCGYLRTKHPGANEAAVRWT